MLARHVKIALRGLASLVIALGIAELVERWVDSVPSASAIAKGRYRLAADPKLGYEPIPNMNAASSKESFMDYTEVSNSLGFRDYEHAAKKPDVFRILVLGDSVTSGHHIGHYTDAFPSVLEGVLREKGLQVEVLNFGVNGYNTQQEVEILKDRGLALSPDLVVVAYCLNDRKRSDGGLLRMLLTASKKKNNYMTNMGSLGTSSRLAQLLEYRYLASQSVNKRFAPLFADTVAEHFLELGKMSTDNDFSTLIAILPDFRDLDTDTPRGDYSEVETLAKNASVPFVQLLPVVQACYANGAPGLFRDHYHPNAAGHKCIANGLAVAIEPMLRR